MNCRYVVERLIVLLIWPVRKRTNLLHNEVKAVEKASFVVNRQQPILPQNLFVGENFIPINQPADAMLWPKTWNGKLVRRTQPFTMSNLHHC